MTAYADRPWLQHYPPEVPHRLQYPQEPLTYFLEQTAARFGDRTCALYFGTRITYRTLLDQARQAAGGLQALGVGKGDRVAVMLPNCPQAVIAYYAILFLGGVVVMVNPTYTVRELAHQLNDAGATVLITLDLVYNVVAQALPLTVIKQTVVTGTESYMPPITRLGFRIKYRKHKPKIVFDAHIHPWSRLLAARPFQGRSPAGPADLALLQYTGGTTGRSKGCMLSHANLVANCVQCDAWLYRLPKGEGTTIGALPFFHVYGMTAVMNFTVMRGSRMVLTPRFDPADVLKLIEHYQAEILPGAPTMYIALLAHPDLKKRNLRSIQACVSGAAPLPAKVQAQWEQRVGGRLVEGYGLSEASPITHANPVWGERRPGIGLPWPDTEVKIVDPETGAEVPVGEPGEMLIKGPQVMLGYYGQTDEHAKVLDDGWLHTGDIAVMDAAGWFRIADRQKDVIIASGFNVYPREIEDVLFTHPAVQEACVVGVRDEYRGETPRAYVVLKPGSSATAEQLITFLKQNLAPYKVPKQIEFRQSLPKDLVGKVLRRVLRAEAAAAAQAPHSA